MDKRQAARVLQCAPEDVDAIMKIYGMAPLGSVNGRGGAYFPGIVKKVAEYEGYRAQLEAEITRKINHEISEHPLGTVFLMRQIASDLGKIHDAPITPEECLRKFIERDESCGTGL